MRVFLTGGTGYIGGHLLKQLLESGHQVAVLARSEVALPPGAELVQGDLESPETYRTALEGQDALVHNAVVWPEEPGEWGAPDVCAGAALFHAAAEAGVRRMVFTSSTAVHRPFQERMSEADVLRPQDAYGATKAAGEAFLWAVAATYGVSATVVRPGPTVGPPATPGARFHCDRRLVAIAQGARQGDEIVVEPGARQFTCVQQLASVYGKLLEGEPRPGTFLAVDPEPATWEEVAQEAAFLAGTRPTVRVDGAPEPEHRFDVSRLATKLGVEIDSRPALRAHLAYLLKEACA
ncbi:MAG: NAD(P)-dependent oxidoreductase [Fimbriimonadaceae bacterium]|nr:NAD(P)-dependent oxidoreductase [Fimbriimonadaceae bacterium]QYK56108.1 MAG: NAD(P)-dependent oxidoreductase [Fimbriimonadaceae bacterium]